VGLKIAGYLVAVPAAGVVLLSVIGFTSGGVAAGVLLSLPTSLNSLNFVSKVPWQPSFNPFSTALLREEFSPFSK
jgi:hypothetical protein